MRNKITQECDVETLVGASLAGGSWRLCCEAATVVFDRDEQHFAGHASDFAITPSLDGVRAVRLDFGFARITFLPTVAEHTADGALRAMTYRGLNSETSLTIEQNV